MGFGSRARATTGRRVRRSDDGGEVTVTNRTRARTNAHEKPEHRDAVLDRFYRANGGKKHDCGACEGDAARATNYDSRTRAVTATCDRHPDPKGRSLTRSATFSLQVRHLVCPLGACTTRVSGLFRGGDARGGSLWVGRGLSRGNTRRSGTVGRGAPSAPLEHRATPRSSRRPSRQARHVAPCLAGFPPGARPGATAPGTRRARPAWGGASRASTRTPGTRGRGGKCGCGRTSALPRER